ncbi:hypothetical protein D3C86_2080940 [compost metagenome]
MQDELAAHQLAAAAVQPRLIGGLGRGALAAPPVHRGEYREHAEQEELHGPGQVREQVGQHADAGGGDADP